MKESAEKVQNGDESGRLRFVERNGCRSAVLSDAQLFSPKVVGRYKAGVSIGARVPEAHVAGEEVRHVGDSPVQLSEGAMVQDDAVGVVIQHHDGIPGVWQVSHGRVLVGSEQVGMSQKQRCWWRRRRQRRAIRSSVCLKESKIRIINL